MDDEGMGGLFGYHRNNDRSNWDLYDFLRFACGDPLTPPPPTNDDPFAVYPPLPPPALPAFDPVALFLQPQVHGIPDAMEWHMAPDHPPAIDPAAVVVGGPSQGISAPPQPQPEDVKDSVECDLALLRQEDPIDVDAISPVSVDAHVAPQQPSPPRTEAPAPAVQPPADAPPLADKMEPSSGGGGAGPSRSRRMYSKKKDRTVTRTMWDLNDSAPPTDTWAWRKYGQKDIKESPNVRSYYKCSTDKQCRARKYVERCNDDPRYLVVSYNGEHTHAMPLDRNTTRDNPGVVNPPPPPPPVSNITAVAQAVAVAAAAAAAAAAPPPSVTASPFPNIPVAVEGPSQAPVLPVFAAASLSAPILKISAAVEETRKAPAPPAIAPSASLSPTTPLRSPSAGLDVEDYRDASAVTMMIIEPDMTPKDSVLFAKRDDDKPQDGIPLPMPEELAQVHHGTPGGSGSGGNHNMMFPVTYEPAAGGSSSGGGGNYNINMMRFPVIYEPAAGSSSGDGSTRTVTASPVPAPIGNLVNEKFCLQQDPWGGLWYWA